MQNLLIVVVVVESAFSWLDHLLETSMHLSMRIEKLKAFARLIQNKVKLNEEGNFQCALVELVSL